jgi:hypothetical protein
MQRMLIMLFLALAALAPAPAAHALRIGDQGTGQVLIYPFYTVDAGNQTVITVVNRSARAKALRVRINEARNGQPALAFNLYLGAQDSWSAALAAVSNPSSPAVLYTSDPSCTVPPIVQPSTQIGQAPLQTLSYTGSNADHPPSLIALDAITRTRTGFVEVIEMGELQAGSGPLQFAEEVAAGTSGVPTNCNALVTAWLAPDRGGFAGNWAADPRTGIDLPGGGLHGNAAVVDVFDGTLYSYPAVALDAFYTNAAAPGALHHGPDDTRPDLRNADSGGGLVVVDVTLADGSVQRETYAASNDILPVSLALLQSRLYNEYSLDPALGSLTEWVVTFPTKRFHVSRAQAGQLPRAPFRDLFDDDGRGAVFATIRRIDRAGRSEVLGANECVCDICGTPPPCTPSRRSLDNSVNVLAFGQTTTTASALLGAVSGEVRVDGGLDAAQFANALSGRAVLEFIQPAATAGGQPVPYELLAPSGRRYLGLPAIALSFTRYTNNNALPGRVATYGDALPHRGERSLILPSP